MEKYLRVAVNSPFNRSILTYRFSENSDIELPERGKLFYAPLGKRKVKACVLGFTDDPGMSDLELIKELDSPYEWELQLQDKYLEFLEWTANYYQYPIGQLIFDTLPKPMKKPRELNFLKGEKEVIYQLDEQQEKAWFCIKNSFHKFSQYLLHGVTGSGKSIVYFQAMQKAVEKGRSALFLLPEINLTPQFIGDIKNSIKAPIFSYHSSLSSSDKYGLWNLLNKSDEPVIVVGVRSAIFLPIQNLGLIIVDEEHDSSFKQEDRCPYNARDLALKLGTMKQVPVILGSASPSVETFQRFQQVSLNPFYIPMPKRFGEGKLPEISLIDARGEIGDEECWPFQSRGLKLIEERLSEGEQVLVFVNRLGFANYLQCRACGHQFYCPNCSVPLKVFRKRSQLNCYTCDYKGPLADECPKCSNLKLQQRGFGTERLEIVLKKVFPEARIERFDRDDISTFSQAEKRLEKFHRGDIDILIGTQMLAKGHNFERVNLVVVLGIDGQLNFPDFRSSEKVYQLLTQISGRAGRYTHRGKVVVQTLNPDNRLFQFVKNHSFDEYYKNEINIRELCQCPPYGHLVILYFIGKRQDQIIKVSSEVVDHCFNLKKNFPKTEALGPRPALIEKRANKFTWVVMLRSQDRSDLHNLLKTLRSSIILPHTVAMKVDIDPYHIS